MKLILEVWMNEFLAAVAGIPKTRLEIQTDLIDFSCQTIWVKYNQLCGIAS